MKPIQPKQPRVRLETLSYQRTCQQVLERDGWRCQVCGSMVNLEVHHQQFRGQGGSDTESNLITLCNGCHRAIHRR